MYTIFVFGFPQSLVENRRFGWVPYAVWLGYRRYRPNKIRATPKKLGIGTKTTAHLFQFILIKGGGGEGCSVLARPFKAPIYLIE